MSRALGVGAFVIIIAGLGKSFWHPRGGLAVVTREAKNFTRNKIIAYLDWSYH
jgi:hypothetical protein